MVGGLVLAPLCRWSQELPGLGNNEICSNTSQGVECRSVAVQQPQNMLNMQNIQMKMVLCFNQSKHSKILQLNLV